MELLEAIKGRRSVRKFLDRPIPYEVMRTILDTARWAPSACNRQLWEFVVVSDPETKRKIADHACFGQRFLKEAPTLVVVFYDDTKERREETHPRKHDAIQSSAAAIQNMHLAAYSLGIGSLWVGAIKEMFTLNDILGVPRTIRPIAVVAFGYPAESPKPPARRPIESFVHSERFGGTKDSYPNSTDPKEWNLAELKQFRERICWFGGTLGPKKTLEKYRMDSASYLRIVDTVKKYSEPASHVLDILPFAGGYLAGLYKALKPEQITAYELGQGNVDCIKQNLDDLGLKEPAFILQGGSRLQIDADPVDLVTCLFRLAKMPDARELFEAAWRSLRSGGYFISAEELPGVSDWFVHPREKNLHTSRHWSTGPQKKIGKKALNRLFQEFEVEIIEQYAFFQGGWIKSLARQLLRKEGNMLVTVLKKK